MAALTVATGPFVVQDPFGQVFCFDTQQQAEKFEAKVRDGGGQPLRLEPPAVLPQAARSLFDIEQSLAILADTTEMVSPDQEAEFLQDFQHALTTAIDKRDRVHQFLAHCEGAAAAADAEIARLQARKAFFLRAVERMEGYITGVIKSLDLDAKGAYQKLKGNLVTFTLKRNPPTVAIQDEAAVPARFKSITITLPAEVWEEACDSFDLATRARVLDAVKSPHTSVSKALVKNAIAEAIPNYLELLKAQPAVFCAAVPGATIAAGGPKLVRS